MPHHQRTADIVRCGVGGIAEHRGVFRERLHAIFAEEMGLLLIVAAHGHTAMAHAIEMTVAIDAVASAPSDREG